MAAETPVTAESFLQSWLRPLRLANEAAAGEVTAFGLLVMVSPCREWHVLLAGPSLRSMDRVA